MKKIFIIPLLIIMFLVGSSFSSTNSWVITVDYTTDLQSALSSNAELFSPVIPTLVKDVSTTTGILPIEVVFVPSSQSIASMKRIARSEGLEPLSLRECNEVIRQLPAYHKNPGPIVFSENYDYVSLSAFGEGYVSFCKISSSGKMFFVPKLVKSDDEKLQKTFFLFKKKAIS
jgi:hypothetical protein